MKKSQLVTLSALAIGLMVVAFVLHKRPPSVDGTQQFTPVTIAQAGEFYLYAPLYVAADQGLFSRRGVGATITSTGGDEKTWAAVISGSAQFGIADPTFVAVASQRGQPGRIIGTIVNGVPFWGIAKNPAIPIITDASQLKGYTVATFPSPSTAYTLQKRMFESAGLQPNIREGAFGTLGALVESGQVDIALELEPNVSVAVGKGYRVIYSLAERYGDFTITGLTATPEYLRHNRATVTAVVGGLQDALDYIHAHPEESARLLAKRFPEIPPDVARQALQRVLSAGIIPKSIAVSGHAWSKALQLRIDAGDVKPVDNAMEFIESFAAAKP